jgi:chromosome segregation ATPase
VNLEGVDNRKGERQMSESDLNRAREERGSEHANPRDHVREMEEHLRDMGEYVRQMGERLRRLDEQLSHLEAQDDRGVDRGTSWPSGG